MTQLRLLLPAIVFSSAMTLCSVAMAASAHNTQTGAHTSNANDSADDAVAKQDKQEQQAAARTVWTLAQ